MTHPQFLMKFEAPNYRDFEIFAGWLIEQTGLIGWNFTSKWLHSEEKKPKTKIFTAVTIVDCDLALLAKLTYPEILLDFAAFDGKLEEYFFYDQKKYRRVANKNYDIIPLNL